MCDSRLRLLGSTSESTNFAKDQTVNILALGELRVHIMLKALPLWSRSRHGRSLKVWMWLCSHKTQRVFQPWDLSRVLKDGVHYGCFLDRRWGLHGHLPRCF